MNEFNSDDFTISLITVYLSLGFPAVLKITAKGSRHDCDKVKDVSSFFFELLFRHLMRFDDFPIAGVIEL